MTLLNDFHAVALDLDGTLVDSAPDLAMAANAALAQLSMSQLSEARIRTLIGDGFEALVERSLAVSMGAAPGPSLVAQAKLHFRRFYSRRTFVSSRLYPDVPDALAALREAGLRLVCTTNKAGEFTRPLMKASGLDASFEIILYPERPQERKPSPHMLERAAAELDVPIAKLLMVGDSHQDVLAARAAGATVAMVSYGYCHGQPVNGAVPNWTIDSLLELLVLPLPAVQPQDTAGAHSC